MGTQREDGGLLVQIIDTSSELLPSGYIDSFGIVRHQLRVPLNASHLEYKPEKFKVVRTSQQRAYRFTVRKGEYFLPKY